MTDLKVITNEKTDFVDMKNDLSEIISSEIEALALVAIKDGKIIIDFCSTPPSSHCELLGAVQVLHDELKEALRG